MKETNMNNNKPHLLVLVGISASGKTTKAKELEQQGWVRVEKDEIRLDTRLFPNGYRYPRDEKRVVKERDRLIRDALEHGKNAISSDTNLNPVHIRQLISIAQEHNAIFEIDDSFLSVPLEELIRRDKERNNSVGEKVIRKQFHEYVKKMPTFVKWNPDLPTCIISDIDGTLTTGPKNRSPYDWKKVGQDEVNPATAHVLDGAKYTSYVSKVFLFSGRSDVCRPETEDWLERHDIEYDELHMRPHARLSDSDVDIKRDIFLEHIAGKYNVLYIMDDRPRVCRMWRDIFGLTVLQLGDPYNDF